MTDDQLQSADLELGRFLDHVEACAKCPGYRKCEFSGFKPKFSTAGGLSYQTGMQCLARKQFLETEKSEKLLRGSKLPTGFEHMTFPTFKVISSNRRAYQAALNLFQKPKEFRRGIYFHGGVGRGKTHLAIAILQARLGINQGGMYVTAVELFQALRPKGGQQDGRQDELLNLVIKSPYLVIDDLGTEKVSEWTLEQLFYIVNARYMERVKRITVLTSNYDPDQLIEKYTLMDPNEGQRIVSRLLEMCYIEQVGGEDRRVG